MAAPVGRTAVHNVGGAEARLTLGGASYSSGGIGGVVEGEAFEGG